MRRVIEGSPVGKPDAAGASHWGVRVVTVSLGTLLFLLPFEPRRPTLALLGFQVTFLEAAAALTFLSLLATCRQTVSTLLRHPPAPLVFITLFAAAHLLAAALAPQHREASVRFALRMSAMAVFAFLVAAAPTVARRRGLVALSASACVVAVLAILEGAGVRRLDPFLDLFREMPFAVGDARRASAGSEYANLAGAVLMYGLLAAVGLGSSSRSGWRLALVSSALLSPGMLFTYSRGALLAMVMGLLAVITRLRAQERSRVIVPLAALVSLSLATVAFALTDQAFRRRLLQEQTQGWYDAAYQSQDTSLALRPGQEWRTTVRLTNAGTGPWARERMCLGHHWLDFDRRAATDGPCVALPEDVQPGHGVVLPAVVTAPPKEGNYLLVWDLFDTQARWLSGQGVRPGTVPTRVSPLPVEPPAPSSSDEVSRAWKPSRAELWGLALGLWAERPWTGVGPDNFRRLYGSRAGRAYWDERVFANNAYLETAATTGVLGLAAFLGTLVSTGLRAFRGSVTLWGLVMALATHGLVDYVFAFTGHYLFLGFVVGASAGERP